MATVALLLLLMLLKHKLPTRTSSNSRTSSAPHARTQFFCSIDQYGSLCSNGTSMEISTFMSCTASTLRKTQGRMEEPDPETWTAWFLDAIRKIRSQKQRPSVERIAHAIRLQHDYHEEVIAENLQLAVKRGDILKLFNKGQSSYKVRI
ncbi:unnamed protein product [Trichogramma brassicae]|uniref:SAMD1-like winged helix (WH) domain-containing protein n=1 Tax=Trichogramma brassicae TaxID=86971 RepID=A0A6H5J4P8_9HYME|nr:unnamed protein product [Trichogramma brassicae]